PPGGFCTEVTVSSTCLTESNSGFCDRRAQRDEASAPDSAQQIGFGIGYGRPVPAKLVVERPLQDQSLLGTRKSPQRTHQSSSHAIDFAGEYRRVRLGGLLNEREGLIDPTRSRRHTRPQKH